MHTLVRTQKYFLATTIHISKQTLGISCSKILTRSPSLTKGLFIKCSIFTKNSDILQAYKHTIRYSDKNRTRKEKQHLKLVDLPKACACCISCSGCRCNQEIFQCQLLFVTDVQHSCFCNVKYFYGSRKVRNLNLNRNVTENYLNGEKHRAKSSRSIKNIQYQ